jgi:hypothetical protein
MARDGIYADYPAESVTSMAAPAKRRVIPDTATAALKWTMLS